MLTVLFEQHGLPDILHTCIGMHHVGHMFLGAEDAEMKNSYLPVSSQPKGKEKGLKK